MNDHSLNDPQLQSLADRLAAAIPQASPAAQQQLLYQCAFAAGERAGSRTLRRWRAISAGLVVLLLCMSVSAVRGRRPMLAESMLAKTQRTPPTPTEVRMQSLPSQAEISLGARQSTTVELDAWQLPYPEHGSLADELAQFQQTDPRLRSLAVGTFARSLMQP